MDTKLSYEPWTHKKVYDFDAVVWIPKGPKYFVTIKERSLQLTTTQGTLFKEISLNEVDSNKGTILFGTLLEKQGKSFFAIERLCYDQGRPWNKGFMETCQRVLAILREQKDHFLGFPLIQKKLENDDSRYPVQCLAYHRGDKVLYGPYIDGTRFQKKETQFQKKDTRIFCIKPDLQNDIYHLLEDDKEPLIACIPDYKTSVMMNRLFRRIKENENLDALEESDDEIEFEDSRDDKFVFLDKSFRMICHWHPRFKKWVPVSLA